MQGFWPGHGILGKERSGNTHSGGKGLPASMPKTSVFTAMKALALLLVLIVYYAVPVASTTGQGGTAGSRRYAWRAMPLHAFGERSRGGVWRHGCSVCYKCHGCAIPEATIHQAFFGCTIGYVTGTRVAAAITRIHAQCSLATPYLDGQYITLHCFCLALFRMPGFSIL